MAAGATKTASAGRRRLIRMLRPTPPDEPDALAIIDGSLCRMDRRGGVAKRHEPIGTAVVEFLALGNRLIVRERVFGFLPGFANLYCLDRALHLLWIAELPPESDLFAGPLGTDGDSPVCATIAGVVCRLNASSGRILSRSTLAAGVSPPSYRAPAD